MSECCKKASWLRESVTQDMDCTYSRRESKLTFDCGGKETDQGELRQPSMAIGLGVEISEIH